MIDLSDFKLSQSRSTLEKYIVDWKKEYTVVCTQFKWCMITHWLLLSDSDNCGETDMTGIEGTISSPNYPENYTSNIFCIYTIQAPEGTKVSLNKYYVVGQTVVNFVN